jgi:hypothetical protein
MATAKEDATAMWKTAATTITTVVIAMAGFWLVEAREYPTRNEVSVMISKESPYKLDQSLITKQLADMERANADVTKALQMLTKEITELRAAVGQSRAN